MTATTSTETRTGPGPGGTVTRSGSAPARLIKAELLKIYTTNSWWIFGILALATTALTLLINLVQADSEISNAQAAQHQAMPDFTGRGPDGQALTPEQGGNSPEEAAREKAAYLDSIDLAKILVRSAANAYTSGQYFGLLFMVVLGALVVTNEFFHQTATTTFLTTPRRTSVIFSKLGAAAIMAAAFWLVTTIIDVAASSAYFSSTGLGVPLGDWPILRSVLFNLLAYIVWAVLGVGLGVLIRSQLGATLTGAAFYLLSLPVALLFFTLLRTFVIKHDWVWNWIIAVPGVASQVMVSPIPVQIGFSENGPINGPAWWVGALVLVGYGIVAGVVGTLITRRRDIS